VSAFGDVQEALAVVITPLLPGPTHVDVETPPDLQDRLPFVRITRYGGPDDGITDHASVDVDVMHTSRALALQLANDIREELTSRPHRVTTAAGVMVLDRATTTTGPFEPPAATSNNGLRVDINLRRFTAAYRVSARRVWA
jgi:hypothetical protein